MEGKQDGKRDHLGKYELLERLGQGGMGEVWKARDTQLQRYVAIKLLRTDMQDNPDFVAYFMREARLVAALRHPNIVQIHDFQPAGSAGGNSYAYMVMDYIEGGTLADAIRGTVRKGLFWSANDIVEFFTAISLALDYAHDQGMIHRDIKPANILLDRSLSSVGHAPGVPILSDFGIARWQGGASTVTGFVGTPLYISPEQAHSHPVSASSDLYSLGIILYEVLTGVTPFRGDNPLAVMLQHVEDQPPPPALINPRISPALSAVILKSIAKDPQERFPSAMAMTRALAQAFHLPVPAFPGEADAQHERPDRGNPLQPVRIGAGLTPLPPVFVPPGSILPAEEFAGRYALPENRRSPIADEVTRVTPGRNLAARENRRVGATDQASQPVTQEPPAPPQLRGRGVTAGRRWVLLGSLVCVVLLLLGTGAFVVAPRLLHSSAIATPTVSGSIAGHILFLRSSSTSNGAFDELQISLNNIPSPPAGQVYYAWLTQENSEALSVPHWPLQVQNGTISDLYTSKPPQTDLFAPSNLFLITEEAGNSTPVVPSPSPSAHLYYAVITHASTSAPTFVVSHCPTSNLNSATNPCR
jgi:serine/threonine-protein kinase